MSKSEKSKDSGLRGTSEGKLYVDHKVFYAREDVKRVLIKLSEVRKRKLAKAN